MIGFGPQTAADYRARMIADALDAADEGIEPDHLADDALEFEVRDIHDDVVAEPVSAAQPAVTLATAAELHDAVRQTVASISPDEFAHGMVVRHPDTAWARS